MKKLSLLKLERSEDLTSDELKRLKGGSCRAWQCQCHGKLDAVEDVDDVLEERDSQGYL